jgi:hypothetical protein
MLNAFEKPADKLGNFPNVQVASAASLIKGIVSRVWEQFQWILKSDRSEEFRIAGAYLFIPF